LSKKRSVIQTFFPKTTYTSRNVFMKSGINREPEHYPLPEECPFLKQKKSIPPWAVRRDGKGII
jgi:hypothetical protein